MDSIVNLVVNQLISNPLIQGAAISLVVSKLRDVFKNMDAAAKDPNQAKMVQLLVMGLSLVATLLTAWSQGHLAQVDPQEIVNFLTVLLAAFGTHDVGSGVKKAIAAKK